MDKRWYVGLGMALLLMALSGPAPAMEATVAGESRIPYKKTEDSNGTLLLRVLGSLALVTLIGVGGVYLLKRYLPVGYRSVPGRSGSIKVVESRRLTRNTTLLVVEVDSSRYVLAETGSSLAVLARHEHQDRARNDSKD